MCVGGKQREAGARPSRVGRGRVRPCAAPLAGLSHRQPRPQSRRFHAAVPGRCSASPLPARLRAHGGGPDPSPPSGAGGGGCTAPPGPAAGGHGAGDEALHASSPPRQEHAWHSRDPPRASPHAPPSEEQGRHRASAVGGGRGRPARNPLVGLTAAPRCYTLRGCTATPLSPCRASPQFPPRGAGWGHGSLGMLWGGDSPAQLWGHPSPLGAAPGCPICPWGWPACQGTVLLCWPSSGHATRATRCLSASRWPCSLLASQSASPVPCCLAPCARRGLCHGPTRPTATATGMDSLLAGPCVRMVGLCRQWGSEAGPGPTPPCRGAGLRLDAHPRWLFSPSLWAQRGLQGLPCAVS